MRDSISDKVRLLYFIDAINNILSELENE